MEKHHGGTLGLPLPAALSTIIESFIPTPMAATLDATLRHREPGTNRWPFENDLISAWITGSTDDEWIVPEQGTTVSRIAKLWLSGHWGSGRTTATASIIEHMIRERSANHAVGYYFCGQSRVPTRDPLNILRTLIAQLAQQSADACKLLETYLNGNDDFGLSPESAEEHDQGPASSLDMEALGELLQLVSQRFERVSIVVNSIDFMPPDIETAFVRFIAALADSPTSNICLLLTSTTGRRKELATELDFCPVLVKGQAEDIRIFAQAEIARRVNRGDTFLQPDHVRIGVEDYIANNSNGAYVLIPFSSV